MTETRFKDYVNFCLTYASSPVGLGVIGGGGHASGFIDNPLYYSLKYIDEQLAAGTPTTNFAGIDLFWNMNMNDDDWSIWNGW